MGPDASPDDILQNCHHPDTKLRAGAARSMKRRVLAEAGDSIKRFLDTGGASGSGRCSGNADEKLRRRRP